MNLKQIKNLFQLTLKLVSWIHQVFKLSEIRPVREYEHLVSHILRVVKTRGLNSGIEYIKLLRTSLVLHLSMEFPGKRVQGIRVTSDGIPLALGPLIPWVRRGRSPDILRIVNTILYATRALHLGRSPNTSPITGPYLGVGLPDFGKYSKSFWVELGYRPSSHIPKALTFKKWHFTTKSGPNGHALWFSLADLSLVTEEILGHLRLVGGEKLGSTIETLRKFVPYLKGVLPTDGQFWRRLSWFPDKELKVRVIAIGDFYSQAALKPFHHYLFRVLKKIPQDCTFNQAAFMDKIIGWEEYFSIDLTDATDRFPITAIVESMKGHLPWEYLQSWEWLMVNKPFEFRGEHIKYSVGNPMGLYSSWASFAVAHHYVMYYCCQEIGISWRDAKYVILGDDVLIGDRRLATTYKRVISSLGVTFSPLKTHESTTLYEFAKRLFYKGKEITPFPVSAIKESAKRYYLLVNLLDELSKRGWTTIEGIPSSIGSFYESIIPRPSTFRAKIREDSLISELIMKVMRGTETAGKALNTLIGHFSYPIRQLTEEESGNILSNVAVEAFAASNPANQDGKGYPLGKLAEDLVILLTSYEDDSMVAMLEYLHMIPHLAVYGQIEEAYINISKEAFRIDTTGGGDWPLLLKTMALPLDDRVFVQRQSHLISRASATIGKHLRTRFEFLASPTGRAMLGW